MLSVQRVNNGFNARGFCNNRTYHYYLPTTILGLALDGESCLHHITCDPAGCCLQHGIASVHELCVQSNHSELCSQNISELHLASFNMRLTRCAAVGYFVIKTTLLISSPII